MCSRTDLCGGLRETGVPTATDRTHDARLDEGRRQVGQGARGAGEVKRKRRAWVIVGLVALALVAVAVPVGWEWVTTESSIGSWNDHRFRMV